MRKRLALILILACCTLLMAACNDEETSSGAPAAEKAAEDTSVQVFESDFGYSMEYDPAVFYVLTDETSDSFGLWNEDVDAALSVAINVERVRGYSLSEYVNSITARAVNGVWSVTEAEFGAAHKTATTVMYEEETAAGLVYHAVTLVKDGQDIIVVETVTYEGLDDAITDTIREMLMTFTY